MTYHFTKTVDMSFDDAVMSTKEALKRHNFRVLTEIDMKDNFKKGLNVDFRPYLILGACNPELSYRALQAKTRSEQCYPATLFCSNKRTVVLKFPQLIPSLPCRPSLTSRWVKLRKRCALTCRV